MPSLAKRPPYCVVWIVSIATGFLVAIMAGPLKPYLPVVKHYLFAGPYSLSEAWRILAESERDNEALFSFVLYFTVGFGAIWFLYAKPRWYQILYCGFLFVVLEFIALFGDAYITADKVGEAFTYAMSRTRIEAAPEEQKEIHNIVDEVVEHIERQFRKKGASEDKEFLRKLEELRKKLEEKTESLNSPR